MNKEVRAVVTDLRGGLAEVAGRVGTGEVTVERERTGAGKAVDREEHAVAAVWVEYWAGAEMAVGAQVGGEQEVGALVVAATAVEA